MADTYKIVRMHFRTSRRRTIETGLTELEAQEHCANPQTSSSTAVGKGAYTRRVGPWFDGYEKE